MGNNTDTDIVDYDKTQVYKNEILPLITQMKKICSLNNMPIFFSCAVKNTNGDTSYAKEGFLTGSNKIGLYKDLFPTYLAVGHIDLVPAAGITKFSEETLGSEGMEYLQNIEFEEDDLALN